MQQRADMIRRLLVEVPAMMQGHHLQIATVAEFKDMQPAVNPVSEGFLVVQLWLDKQRRLGVQFPAPETLAEPGMSYNNFNSLRLAKHPLATSDVASDIDLLAQWCDAAPSSASSLAASPGGISGGRLGAGPCQSPHSKSGPTGSAAESDAASQCGDDLGDDGVGGYPSMPNGILDGLPKGRLATNVRKVHQKIAGVLAQAGTASWRDALYATQLRSIVRSAAGLEKELATADSPRLIALNMDQAAMASHIQLLHKALVAVHKEATPAAFIETVAPATKILEGIPQFLGDGTFDAELLIVIDIGRFWQAAFDNGLDEGFSMLDFDKDVSRLASNFDEFIRRPAPQPSKEIGRLFTPCPFRQFVCEELVMKFMVKKLASQTFDPSAVNSAADALLVPFGELVKIVESDAFCRRGCSSDLATQRARSMLSVVQACSRFVNKPSSSQLQEALDIVRAGAEKHHELCSGFTQFAVGKALLSKCDEVVERSSEDLVGDACLEAAADRLAVAAPRDRLESDADPKKYLVALSCIPFVLSKISGSIQSWSPIRMEEQWNKVEGLIDEIVNLCSDAMGLIVDNVAIKCTDMNAKAPGVEGTGAAGALAKFAELMIPTVVDEMNSLKDLAGSTLGMLSQVSDMLTAIPRTNKGFPESLAEFTSQRSAIQIASECCASMVSVLIAWHSMLALLARPPRLEPNDDFAEAWTAFEDEFPISPSGVLRERLMSFKLDAARHTMFFVLSFCRCRNFTRRALGSEWLQPTTTDTDGEGGDFSHVVSTMESVHESIISMKVWESVCKDILSKIVADATAAMRMGDLKMVDDESVRNAPVNQVLPQLVGGDLDAPRQIAATTCSFPSLAFYRPAQLRRMPHQDRVSMIEKIANLMLAGNLTMSFDCLQYENGPPLRAAGLSAVLDLYSAMWSAVCIAAFIHSFLHADLCTASRSSTDNTVVPGFAVGLVQAVTALGEHVTNVQALLNNDIYKHMDALTHSLRVPIGACKQWTSGVNMFVTRIKGEAMDHAMKALYSASSTLESATPRWQMVITASAIDDALARGRILKNPHRWMIRPTMGIAALLRDQVTCAAIAWKIEIPAAVNSAISFCTSAMQAAEELILVTAALNTILTTREKKTAAHMASEVLTLAQKCQGFVFPPILLTKLQNLAEGASSSTTPATSSSPPSLESPGTLDKNAKSLAATSSGTSSASSAVSPPVKRELVDSGAASSSSSSAVKREPTQSESDAPCKKARFSTALRKRRG